MKTLKLNIAFLFIVLVGYLMGYIAIESLAFEKYWIFGALVIVPTVVLTQIFIAWEEE